MIDDEIRAQLEMLGPPPMNARQQTPGVRAEDEPDSRSPAVRARRIPVVAVFPRRATVVRFPGGKPTEIAAGPLHEIDRVELVGDQPEFVVERDERERGRLITIGEIGEPLLQCSTEGRLSRRARPVDENHHGRRRRNCVQGISPGTMPAAAMAPP